MEWSGQKEFVASKEVPFVVDGSEAGLLKNYGPLSFLKVTFSLLSLSRLPTGKKKEKGKGNTQIHIHISTCLHICANSHQNVYIHTCMHIEICQHHSRNVYMCKNSPNVLGKQSVPFRYTLLINQMRHLDTYNVPY